MFRRVFLASCVVLVLAGAIACKNDIEYIQSLSAVEDLPIQTGKNFETFYSDSAKLQVIFMAPKVERYLKKGDEDGYYEFTEGVEIRFFDKHEKLEAILTANYAKYWEEQALGMARDSVVMRNIITGEQLNTEELFWDRNKSLIYSKVFTKITNNDGVYYGEGGFEADQDFKNYKLIGSSGTVKVQDEELQ